MGVTNHLIYQKFYPLKQSVTYEEVELVEMLRSGSNIGFGYLYDNYSGALLSAIISIVNDRGIAADVLQDVFVSIFRKIDTFDGSKNHLHTWMMAIARNQSIDTLRSKGYRNNRQNGDLSQAFVIGSHNAAQKVDHIGLQRLFSKIKPTYWEVIDLNYFKGYTHEEIAMVLSLPLGTVKTRIRAALVQLRKVMEERTKL